MVGALAALPTTGNRGACGCKLPCRTLPVCRGCVQMRQNLVALTDATHLEGASHLRTEKHPMNHKPLSLLTLALLIALVTLPSFSAAASPLPRPFPPDHDQAVAASPHRGQAPIQVQLRRGLNGYNGAADTWLFAWEPMSPTAATPASPWPQRRGQRPDPFRPARRHPCQRPGRQRRPQALQRRRRARHASQRPSPAALVG